MREFRSPPSELLRRVLYEDKEGNNADYVVAGNDGSGGPAFCDVHANARPENRDSSVECKFYQSRVDIYDCMDSIPRPYSGRV